MFEKGEYIVYGTTGVCQVMDITTMKQKEAPQAKLYYVLEPVSSPGGKILTPVEENKNPMRRIVTREEADRLIEEIRNVKDLQIGDEKQREAKYKEALKSCDCKAWIGIIKTLYRRKKDRMVRGKAPDRGGRAVFSESKRQSVPGAGDSFRYHRRRSRGIYHFQDRSGDKPELA